ncbi:MAG TPA: hypothetical protein VNO30_04845 [Kofleriaceae bacterium]|nr:hypothetical protein [Kofleriaceae bacterium]
MRSRLSRWHWHWLSLAVSLALLAAACGGTGGDDGDDGGGIDPVFDSAITRVVIEIDHETGQEPYTGPVLGFGDTFDLTAENVDRLFSGKKMLTVPRTAAEMEDVGAVADEELTSADLLALAEAHRGRKDEAGTKTYYVLFISGHFADADGVQPSVLGVSLGNTGVIAMFKDVIRSTSAATLPNLVRFVEQSTLVHELAHSIGLVDNGLPATSAHVDTPHGAHCTNDKCVMYYLNEGATDAAMFARQVITTGNRILFDASCLADADAVTGGR